MIRLLHLEDDPDILEISQMALQMTGAFELMQCATGDDAIARAEAFAPDALLLDVMVPGTSGPDVLRALRKLPGLQEVPAIFMTARVQPSEVQDLLDQGAIAVIAKPFDPMSLGPQILAAVEDARTGQETAPQGV